MNPENELSMLVMVREISASLRELAEQGRARARQAESAKALILTLADEAGFLVGREDLARQIADL